MKITNIPKWKKLWLDLIKNNEVSNNYDNDHDNEQLQLYSIDSGGYDISRIVGLVERDDNIFLEFNEYKHGNYTLKERFKVTIHES